MESTSVALPASAGLPWHVFPWWFLRLYRAPLAFLVGLLIVPLSLLCWWLYVTTEHQWRAQEAHDLRLYAELASRTLQEELRRVQQLEQAVAAQPAWLAAVKRRDRRRIEEGLRLLMRIAPSIARAVVADQSGQLVAEVATPSDSIGSAHELKTAPPVSAVYLYDPISGEKAVGLSIPLRDGATVLGSLRAQIRLGTISRWLAKIRIEPAGFLYVVDEHDLLVSYPFQLLAGAPKRVSDWPAVARSRAAAPSALVQFRQGKPGQPWTAAIVSMTPFSWRVIAQQPDAAMLRSFRRVAGSLAVMLIALVSLISLLVLRWAHMHHITLHLLAQQAELLKRSHQHDVRTAMRQQRHAKDPNA